MDAAVVGFIVLGLAIGGIVGWLLGSRSAATARQITENLRLQLDEVVKERDSNRTASHELAGLKAAQEERDRSHQQQLQSLETRFAEVSNKLLAEAQDEEERHERDQRDDPGVLEHGQPFISAMSSRSTLRRLR